MAMMSKKDDQKICTMISNKLAARGIRAPCNVMVSSNNGEVTLSGTVVQAHQKVAARHAAEGIQGVKRVYERLTVKAVAKRSDDANGQWTIKPMKAPESTPPVASPEAPTSSDSPPSY
jgi:hypothetical protein